ncbi:hypothetical protein V8E51_014146 [Hyaloscypha variabilis]
MSRRSNPRYSPFSPGPDDRASNAGNSLWDAQSEQDFNHFDLPPIDDIFDNAHYFDALPRFPSPDPFLSQSSQSQNSQNILQPPPSNQQARRHVPPISQYRVAGSESPDPFDDFLNPPSPNSPAMPPTTRSSSVVDLTSSPPKHGAPPPSRKRKAATPGEGRASKTARPNSSRSSSTRQQSLDNIPLVDLVDVNDDKQYEALRAKEQAELIKAQNEAEANKPVRLAAFECIICMSNPTDLTVTHCGHLFCSECLHHALHAGDKKCCPVCRTVINPGKPGHKTPKTGVFALEMKLMTAKRKGKQPIKTQ